MNTKLITALRTSAKAIDNGTFTYDWLNPTRCNCGVLACSLLGKSPIALSGMIHDMPKQADIGKTWTHFASTVCPITGIPEHQLFKTLFSHGLTQADFHHLEYLTDPEITAAMVMPIIPTTGEWFKRILGIAPVREVINNRNGAHVALYMRAWADILEKRGHVDADEIQQEETDPALISPDAGGHTP